MVSQTDRIALRVNFPFALVHVKVHLGLVRLPFTACRPVIERIGIRVDADQRELAVDDTCKEIAEILVPVGELYIRPYLGT